MRQEYRTAHTVYFEIQCIISCSYYLVTFMECYLIVIISHLYDESDNSYNNFNPDEDIADII